ncbi:MAG TPA: ABC transporter substrate-binding protein [Gemmatimonadales bacterium]|nr:ABC transporter substrate-binding protein [Gemmatimonadales bacterium]
MTRKHFLRGVGAAWAGGLVVGGVAGYFGGRASESMTTTQATASTSKEPLVIGSGVPVTGVYAGDGQQMLRGQQLAVAEINAAGGVLGQPLKLAILDTKAHTRSSAIPASRCFTSTPGTATSIS